MNKRNFLGKKLIAALLVAAVSVAAAAIYLAWLKPGEIENNIFTPEVGELVNLPNPETKGAMSVEEAIQRRRSIRSFSDEPLSLKEISQLMWAAQGITDPAKNLRAAPSAGATYPLEVYLVVGRNCLEGLAEGLYIYDANRHCLHYVLNGDLRASLAEAALGQGWVREAPVNIVITAVYERTTSRYAERGVRYVHMEAGHVGQNLYLQATALGLGMVTIGAFDDSQVQKLLQLPDNQKPLYIIPIGYP